MVARQPFNHPVSRWYGRASTVVWVAVLVSILPSLTLLGNVLVLTHAVAILLMTHRQKPAQTVRERIRLGRPFFPLILLLPLGLILLFTPADGFFLMAVMYPVLLVNVPVLGVCLPLMAVQWLLGRRRSCAPKAVAEIAPIISTAGISAICMGIIMAGCCLALIHLDDRLIPRPSLHWERPQLSEEENGFNTLESMMPRWPLNEDEELEGVLYEQYSCHCPLDMDEDWMLRAEEALAPWQGCLGQADRILASPGWAWPEEVPLWEEFLPLDEEEKEVGDYARTLAQLWLARSEIHRLRGEQEEALQEAENLIRYALLSGKSADSMIHAAMSGSWASWGASQLGKIALSPDVPPEILDRAREILPPHDTIKRIYVEGLKGEHAQVVALVRNHQTPFLHNIDSGDHGVLIAKQEWLLRDSSSRQFLKMNRMLNLVGALAEHSLARLEHYEPKERPAKVRSDPFFTFSLADGKVRLGLVDFLRSPAGFIDAMMIGMFMDTPVTCHHFESLARLRMNHLAVALRRYQLDHGELPKELDQLVPAYLDTIPVDPFTEESFHYEPDHSPPRLWSLGPNLKPDSAEGWEKDDVLMELTVGS